MKNFFYRTSPLLVLALCAGLVFSFASARAEDDTASGAAVLSGLNPDNTGKAVDGSLDKTIVDGTEFATQDKMGEAVKQLGEASKEDAAVEATLTRQSQNRLVQQPTGGLSPENKTLRSQLIKEGDEVIENTKGAGTWCSKIGKVLDVINVVAVGAQAAGYAAEGDMNGASGAVVDETTKRVTSVAGAFVGGLGGGQVGAILGATAGEEFHNATTKKLIEKNVDNARNEDARDKMLGTGAAPVQIMTESGGTRTLASDMYVEPGTGNIKQMTPEQQKENREKISQEIRNRPVSESPLDIADAKLKRGEITQAQFDQEINAFNDPHRIPAVDEAPPAQGFEGDRGEGDEAQPAPEPKPEPAAANEAKEITPVQVTATVSFDEDYSYQGIQNIVHSVATLTFWNVGSLQPDYGGVTVHMTSTASVNGVAQTVTGGGSFSGGPNGVFHLTVGDKAVSGNLENGSTLIYAGKQGSVGNPDAFTPWNK